MKNHHTHIPDYVRCVRSCRRYAYTMTLVKGYPRMVSTTPRTCHDHCMLELFHVARDGPRRARNPKTTRAAAPCAPQSPSRDPI